MRRLLIILCVLILAGCTSSSTQIAPKSTPRGRRLSLPTPTETPEMLIRRPTEAREPTATLHEMYVMATRSALMPTATFTPGPPKDFKPTSAPCNIKGNVSSGNRIYHCQNWRDYNKIQMNYSEGDRWFCSEDKARAAGFREPEYSHGGCRQ